MLDRVRDLLFAPRRAVDVAASAVFAAELGQPVMNSARSGVRDSVVRTRGMPSPVVAPLRDALLSHGTDAVEGLRGLFAKNDVVVLGDNHATSGIAAHEWIARNLLPTLVRDGVHIVCVEARGALQPQIDDYLAGRRTWDEVDWPKAWHHDGFRTILDAARDTAMRVVAFDADTAEPNVPERDRTMFRTLEEQAANGKVLAIVGQVHINQAADRTKAGRPYDRLGGLLTRASFRSVCVNHYLRDTHPTNAFGEGVVDETLPLLKQATLVPATGAFACHPARPAGAYTLVV